MREAQTVTNRLGQDRPLTQHIIRLYWIGRVDLDQNRHSRRHARTQCTHRFGQPRAWAVMAQDDVLGRRRVGDEHDRFSVGFLGRGMPPTPGQLARLSWRIDRTFRGQISARSASDPNLERVRARPSSRLEAEHNARVNARRPSKWPRANSAVTVVRVAARWPVESGRGQE